MRSLKEALADHGVFYTREDLPNGLIRIWLHGSRGMLGHYCVEQAWDLVHEWEDAPCL